jgi:hypothetical protein
VQRVSAWQSGNIGLPGRSATVAHCRKLLQPIARPVQGCAWPFALADVLRPAAFGPRLSRCVRPHVRV